MGDDGTASMQTTVGSGESWEDEAFDRAFAMVAYQLNRYIVDHMLRCYRTLGLDLEAIMLLGVLSHQNIAHLIRPGASVSDTLGPNGQIRSDRQLELRPLRIRDLVQITGVPRETVRRKLAIMEEKEIVRRVERGWVIDGRYVSEEIREFNRESVRRLLSAASEVRQTLQSAHQRRG